MMRAGALAALALALLCAGCGKTHRGALSGDGASAGNSAAGSKGPASDARANVPHVLRADIGDDTSLEGAAGGSADAPPPSGPEVWVGELWSLTTRLCDGNGWTRVPDGTTEGHSEHVVLMLDHTAGSAQPSGRIRFGDGELPSEPDVWPIDDPNVNSLFTCSFGQLASGGVYSLLEPRYSRAQLHFELAPAEIWQPWCTRMHFRAWTGCDLGEECCPCDKNGCRPGVGSRIVFDFTVTGDTMDTTLDWSGTTQVRLKRMH